MIGSLQGVRPIPYDTAALNLVAFGNSIVRGFGATSANTAWPAQLGLLPPINGRAAFTNKGIDGNTIPQMIARVATDVTPLFDASKQNVLIVLEATNTVGTLGYTGQQTADAMQTCLATILAAHPWKIILSTTAPRFDTNAGDVVAWNAAITQYNNLMKANYRAFGAKVLCDIQAAGLFAADSAATSIPTALQPYMYDTVHPNDGGYGIMAGYFASALRRLGA